MVYAKFAYTPSAWCDNTRMDAVEGDIKQIKGGISYLVQQLSAPPDPPRRRIGFGSDAVTPAKPYVIFSHSTCVEAQFVIQLYIMKVSHVDTSHV